MTGFDLTLTEQKIASLRNELFRQRELTAELMLENITLNNKIAELERQPMSDEPVAFRFTQNRGNGKTAFTYHDFSDENHWRTAYMDNCLKIDRLYLYAARPPISDAKILELFEQMASLHAIPVGKESTVMSALVGFQEAKEFARAIEMCCTGGKA